MARGIARFAWVQGAAGAAFYAAQRTHHCTAASTTDDLTHPCRPGQLTATTAAAPGAARSTHRGRPRFFQAAPPHSLARLPAPWTAPSGSATMRAALTSSAPLCRAWKRPQLCLLLAARPLCRPRASRARAPATSSAAARRAWATTPIPAAREAQLPPPPPRLQPCRRRRAAQTRRCAARGTPRRGAMRCSTRSGFIEAINASLARFGRFFLPRPKAKTFRPFAGDAAAPVARAAGAQRRAAAGGG